jgi:drug/metabolite transporter (DMT)-like permease
MSVYVVLVFQQLIAAGTHIVAKTVVQDIEPVSLTFFRSIVTAALLVIALLLRRTRWRIERRDYLSLIWLSLLAVPINQFLFFDRISRTTASNAALLYATTPVVVLVLSRFILKELLTWKKVVGVIIALIGVTFIIFEDGFELNSSHTYGNLLLMVAVLAWSLFTIFGKPMIQKYGAFYVTSLVLIIGMVLYLPIGLLVGSPIPLESLSARDLEGLLYFAVGTSFLGYFLWYFALGRMEAGKVAIFSNAQPFLTTLLAVVLLSQSVSPTFVLGGVVTISGVVLVQFG